MAGEIPPERDPEETAGLLLAALLGVSVLARLRPDAARLAGMVPPILALFAHEPQNASPTTAGSCSNKNRNAPQQPEALT
jgi:hypothetical protein